MELSQHYDPSGIEDKWYKHWMTKGYFKSIPDSRQPFTIVIPPPNVTGVLHMGHTLNETVQDILVRNARMSGFNACWVPGSDHASIATESKVVEMLKQKGINKSALTREEFLKYAFEWKEKYGSIIYHQIEKLGCSVDWDRVCFTMDDEYYEAVISVFVDLYNKGLIYRGARMIHWDPSAKTALSDEEVEYKEVQGILYYINYPVVDSLAFRNQDLRSTNFEFETTEFITIATQRPETIMGDTAVCINPNDARYIHLKGKYAVIPLVNRVVPIITDEYVDPEFGTGALKITPAHDLNDYNLGLKHHLEVINTLNEDGTLSEAAQVFVGMDRFEARIQVVKSLKDQNLLIKEEQYQTRLGFSQRSNAIVESRISTQWFVSMRELADKALVQVKNGKIKIHPEEKFLNTYKYWLENIKDWCISRQLWWGQRIPAWYDTEGKFVVAPSEEEARKIFKTRHSIDHPQLTQDPDVLDTWFSSWLWPIQVFKGITKPGNPDANYYYPTSVLVTGQDIIFFWVARMIMAGMEYKNERPFDHVYFTGMVRDRQGRKMSKTLGNSPDLLEMIDKYGADAVRFGILIAAPAGNDLLFDDSSPEQGRNFNNKLWNALKLIKMWELKQSAFNNQQPDSASQKSLMVMDVSAFAGSVDIEEINPSPIRAENNFAVLWFKNRLESVRLELDQLLSNFKLSEALKTIYSLIWDDFCSWYLEWVKPAYGQPVDEVIYQRTVEFFTDLLQLLHPFMPFITEEIYHLLKEREKDLCILQFTAVTTPDEEILQTGILLKEVITGLRDARVRNRLKNKDEIKLYIMTESPERYMSFYNILLKQVNANAIAFNTEALGHSVSVVIGKDKFFVETAESVDPAYQKEELDKELEYLKGFLDSVNKKLTNERFLKNAKPEVVTLEQQKKSDTEAKIKIIEESLSGLQ